MNWLVVLATFVDLFATIFNALIIVRIVMSYFARPTNRLFNSLVNVTEPVLWPVRRLVRPKGQVDWSPTLTVIGLYLLDILVSSLIVPQ